MNSELKLLPCPFCGNEKTYFSDSYEGLSKKPRFVVNCQGCVVSTSVPMWDKIFAAEVWNRRVDKGDKQ